MTQQRTIHVLIISAAWWALSLIAFSVTDNNAHACANQFIGAIASNQCTPWVAVHSLSVACLWLSALLGVAVAGYGVWRYGRPDKPTQ